MLVKLKLLRLWVGNMWMCRWGIFSLVMIILVCWVENVWYMVLLISWFIDMMWLNNVGFMFC